jgi:MFS family permease
MQISVIFRPFGSYLLGAVGDKHGRVATLKISTIIAAAATLGVAFVPNYRDAGIFSVLILLILRIIFMISLAGEIDAIKIYVAEKIGKNRRNLAVGIVSFSAQVGVLLAAIMYHLVVSTEHADWLWRLNFLIGGVLGFFIFYFRNHYQESELFLNSQKKRANIAESKNTDKLLHIFYDNKGKFLMSMLVSGLFGGSYHFMIIFINSFMSKGIGAIDISTASSNNMFLVGVYGISSLVSGLLSDRFKSRFIVLISIIANLVLSFLLVVITNTAVEESIAQNNNHIFLLQISITALLGLYMVPTQVKLQSLFETRFRMRMYGLSHSLGSMIFSSTAPLIGTLIWRNSGSLQFVFFYFFMIQIVIFLGVIYLWRKNYTNMFEKG